MKNLSLLPSMGLILLLGSCRVPSVYFFDADPYTQSYQTSFQQPLTVVIGEDIEDEFTLRDGMKPMEVKQFRKSLRITLYYMLEQSFPEVTFADQPDSSGYTLQLYRVRPGWKVLSESTSVSGYEGVVVSSTSARVAAQIRYDGAIYKNGEKIAILDDEVVGEKSTDAKKRMPDTFRDGVRELCENLYKDLLKTEVQTYREPKP